MQGAARGTELDMSRARSHPPPRRQAPLSPPSFEKGARDRVAEALQRRREANVPLADDECRPLFTDEPDEDETPALRGRLVVPEDTEL
jgi:hypothetical protein